MSEESHPLPLTINERVDAAKQFDTHRPRKPLGRAKSEIIDFDFPIDLGTDFPTSFCLEHSNIDHQLTARPRVRNRPSIPPMWYLTCRLW